MKILLNTQQSVYNDEGKWSRADSNVQMTCDLLRSLKEVQSDWWENELELFDVLIAPEEDFFDLDSHRDLVDYDKVNWLPHSRPVDAFTARYQFDVDEWKFVLASEDYDVVINNVTEISRNIKTVLHRLGQEDTKLVTNCFWMDCPRIGEEKVDEEISYDWRQFDGFECSDLAAFTCESTKDAFFRNAAHKFVGTESFDIRESSSIWDFGYSQREAQKNFTEKTNLPKRKRILFLNRLSGINYTHHEEFIAAVNHLYDKRQDFEVVFTNPSKKVPHEDLLDWCDPAIDYKEGEPLDREEYWGLLQSGSISVHLFMKERYGGCALRESIAAGNLPVVANCHEQGKMVPSKWTVDCDPVNDEVSPARIASKLDDALNSFNTSEMFDSLQKLQDLNEERCSFESTSETVVEDLNRLVKS